MTTMPSATPVISSTSNLHVRAAMALRDRSERDRTGLTLVDGAREARRALDAGVDIVEAFVCEAQLAGPDARSALDRLVAGPATVHRTAARVLDRLGFGGRSEGLVLVVRIPDTRLERLVLAPIPLIIVVERVEKPGNLGAILRSADGAGADAVIAASPVTDLFNPNTIRASAGAVFHVPLGAGPSAEVLSWLNDRHIRIITARVDARRPYTEADLTGPLAIVLGAETDGLTDAWAADDIEAVSIPMAGVADSLNVSVSTAILSYEARRRRDLDSA